MQIHIFQQYIFMYLVMSDISSDECSFQNK